MELSQVAAVPAWDDSLLPIAERVGPFPWRPFLSAWWEELAPPGQLLWAEHSESAMVLFRAGKVIEFAGDSDLTDYHSPLGGNVLELSRALVDRLPPGTLLRLDSLPAEALKPIEEGLASGGLHPTVTEHEVAMVVELPDTIDGYYGMLGKKERHELRRKRRRYESEVGAVVLATERGQSYSLEEFFRLHRMAEGSKGVFMTPARERFFRRLADQPGWRVDAIIHDGRATACLFAWADDSTYYLYNSSYDPARQHASPGLVALSAVIDLVIGEGLSHLDFLKGDEPYKTRLGAQPRPLFRLEALTPEGRS